MAKDKITDYDSTASGNLDVGGISVAEGMLPSGVNNAIRELMSHQADAFGAGTPLYVDQTNNRLGIGTSSPAELVTLAGHANHRLLIEATDTTVSNGADYGGIAWKTNDVAQPSLTTWEIFQEAVGSTGESELVVDYKGVEAFRIDNNRNVGIGTSSPDSGTPLHVEESSASLGANPAASALLVERAGNVGMTLGTANTGLASIFMGDTDSLTVGRVQYDNSDNSLQFWANGIERVRILSGGGIAFNGETTAAHALDDYEEGVWYPEVRTSGGDVLSATTLSGRFTKIGRLVHITGDLVNIDTTGGTSTHPVRAYDLPFTVDEDLTFGSCISSVVTLQNGRTQLTARANTSDFIEFFANGSAQGYTPVDVGDLSSGVSDLNFSITYYTDQ